MQNICHQIDFAQFIEQIFTGTFQISKIFKCYVRYIKYKSSKITKETLTELQIKYQK